MLPALPPFPETNEAIPAFIEALASHPKFTGALANQRAADTGQSTKHQFYKEGVGWTADRREQHLRAVEAVLVSDAAADAEPVALIIMGLPGAGKTSRLGPSLDAKFPGISWTRLDPDLVKTHLPGYAPIKAPIFHEESSDVCWENAMREAIQRIHNVKIDQVGSNPPSMIRRVEVLEQAGYELHAALARIPATVSVRKIVERFLRREADSRWVPLDLVLEFEAGVEATWRVLKESGSLSSYVAFNTNTAPGLPPEQTESGP